MSSVLQAIVEAGIILNSVDFSTNKEPQIPPPDIFRYTVEFLEGDSLQLASDPLMDALSDQPLVAHTSLQFVSFLNSMFLLKWEVAAVHSFTRKGSISSSCGVAPSDIGRFFLKVFSKLRIDSWL